VGGLRATLLNSTIINLLKTYPTNPQNIGDSLDTSPHIHSTYYGDGLELFGMGAHILLIVFLQPSHSYIAGEWQLNRLNLYLSDEDDLGNNEGYGWGMRLIGKNT
jgi:hypothetical protein